MRCPTCHKAVDAGKANPWRPFCSERCRLIDLGEWVSEGHRIPGEPADPEAGWEAESQKDPDSTEK